MKLEKKEQIKFNRKKRAEVNEIKNKKSIEKINKNKTG